MANNKKTKSSSKTNKNDASAKSNTNKTNLEKTNTSIKKPTVKLAISKYLQSRNNKIFIANWKMNKKFEDIKSFAFAFNHLLHKDKVIKKSNFLIGVAPTSLGLLPCAGMLKNNVVTVAQNISPEKNGAFTGQLSYDQIHEYNINYALVGHSEVRNYLNVTDKIINDTVKVLIQNNMRPVLCIGDTKEQYDEKKSEKTIALQLMNDLKGISESQIKNVIIAYEPVWAIGSTVASDEWIKNMTKFIRDTLKDMYDEKTAKEIHILYGGSVKVENSPSILSIKGIDGVLIGGASLDHQSFYEIICSCPEYKDIQKIILTKNGQKPLPKNNS